jgi:hypothetical protein
MGLGAHSGLKAIRRPWCLARRDLHPNEGSKRKPTDRLLRLTPSTGEPLCTVLEDMAAEKPINSASTDLCGLSCITCSNLKIRFFAVDSRSCLYSPAALEGNKHRSAC